MSPGLLHELRLMASARFDSQPLLCVVLAGDSRLTDKLRRDELLPLGRRIRSRLALSTLCRTNCWPVSTICSQRRRAAIDEPATASHAVRTRGGNYRVMTTLAGELLAVAAQRELPALDEKLYFDVFAPAAPASRRQPARQSSGAR